MISTRTLYGVHKQSDPKANSNRKQSNLNGQGPSPTPQWKRQALPGRETPKAACMACTACTARVHARTLRSMRDQPNLASQPRRSSCGGQFARSHPLIGHAPSSQRSSRPALLMIRPRLETGARNQMGQARLTGSRLAFSFGHPSSLDVVSLRASHLVAHFYMCTCIEYVYGDLCGRGSRVCENLTAERGRCRSG